MFGIDKSMNKIYEKAKRDLGIFLQSFSSEHLKSKKLVVKPIFKDGFQVEFSLEDKQ